MAVVAARIKAEEGRTEEVVKAVVAMRVAGAEKPRLTEHPSLRTQEATSLLPDVASRNDDGCSVSCWTPSSPLCPKPVLHLSPKARTMAAVSLSKKKMEVPGVALKRHQKKKGGY